MTSCFPVFAVGEQTIGCFTSGATNVKFVQMDMEGANLAYVKYQKSKVAIPLMYISESSERNAGGGPDEVTTTWAEILKGKVNGYYMVMSQGARFYRVEYKSKKNVITNFEDNINAYNESGTDCHW